MWCDEVGCVDECVIDEDQQQDWVRKGVKWECVVWQKCCGIVDLVWDFNWLDDLLIFFVLFDLFGCFLGFYFILFFVLVF